MAAICQSSGGLKLQAKEVGITRIQSGIQTPLDGCKIEGIVFKTGMVAHHQEGQSRQSGHDRQSFAGKVATRQRPAGGEV